MTFANCCDRIVVMNEGAVFAEGTPAQVLRMRMSSSRSALAYLLPQRMALAICGGGRAAACGGLYTVESLADELADLPIGRSDGPSNVADIAKSKTVAREEGLLMEAFSFGSYYPGDSAIHRLDPRNQVALLGFVVSGSRRSRSVASADWHRSQFSLCRSAPCLGAGSSRSVVDMPLLAIVVVVAVLNLFTNQSGRILWQLGFLRISEGSLHSAAFMACRLTLMMAGMSAITLTTPTLDLTAGFERLLAPFARVGLPAHELGNDHGYSAALYAAVCHRDEADGRCTGKPRCTRDGRSARRRAYARQCGDSTVHGRVPSCRDVVCRHGCPLLLWRAGPHIVCIRLHLAAAMRVGGVVTMLLFACVIVVNLQLV